MSKNSVKNNKNSSDFAENNANIDASVEIDSKKMQNSEVLAENTTDTGIDKKLVKSILKEEKRQLKETKKLEKQKKKDRKKKRRQKIKQLIKNKKLEEKQIRKTQEETIRELEKRGKFASWFRLDNAASIYPSAVEKDWNFVYRITATFYEKINPAILQMAVDDIMPRFPSFNVRLCHGFFWNYYERNFSRLKIEREADFPCRPFDLENTDGFLIRILYSDHNIMLEVFHGISDGRGSLYFFNSLIARYLERLGEKIENYVGCSSYLDIPSEEEIEDSFFSNATQEKIKREKEHAAYKIKGNYMPSGMVNTVEGEMSVSQVKEVAKKFGTSISVFLSAVVGYVVYKKRKNSKKPVRISVPIDLRTRFGSSTLRNFSSYVNVEVDGDNLSFEDVVNIIKEKLGNIDKRTLQANINANVKIQKNFFVKIMPLFLKNIVLKTCFNYLGENYQTLALSNIGKVEVPKEFEKHIDSYSINLGRSLHNEKSIGVISFKDKLNMCISSKLYETETERDIFKILSSFGIDITVYSNRRDLYGTR